MEQEYQMNNYQEKKQKTFGVFWDTETWKAIVLINHCSSLWIYQENFSLLFFGRNYYNLRQECGFSELFRRKRFDIIVMIVTWFLIDVDDPRKNCWYQK